MDKEYDIFGFVVLVVSICIAFAIGQATGRDTFGHMRSWRLFANSLGFGCAGAVIISIPSFFLIGTEHRLWPYVMAGNGIATMTGVLLRGLNAQK